ncbi:MAG: ATP-binding protein [Granulosicoccus sp.]
MNQGEISFLDVLALLGGGRGGRLSDLNPHLLAALFWATLCVYQFCIRKSDDSRADDLLMAAFVAACVNEAIQVGAALALAMETGTAFLQGPVWPPLAMAMNAACITLIAAAFVQFLIKCRASTVQFIAIAMALVAVVHAYLASKWWTTWQADPAADFATQRYVWAGYLTIIVILIIAIANSLFSGQPRRQWIVSGFTLLIASLVLSIFASLGNLTSAQLLAPVNGCLQLAAIGFFAYSAMSLHVMTEKRLSRHVKNSRKLETLGLLSSGIAHDFNSLLQIIVGYVELAKSETSEEHPGYASLLHVEDAAQRACALTSQLLSFELLKEPEFESVDVNGTITRLAPLLSRLLGNQISINYDLSSALKPVNAEVRSLEQIILNLVDNAKDAIDGSGTIVIQTRALVGSNSDTDDNAQNRGVQLIVSDDGQGMDKQTVDRIFEPFFTTKPQGEGTGLGMAIVYSAVQKLDGIVYIDSEPGLSTRVIVQIPEASDHSSKDQKTLEYSAQCKAYDQTILIALGERALNDLLSTLLQSAGYGTIMATDGFDTIRIANTYKGKIDLCLIDADMPVCSGYGAYERISQSRPGMPVLFMTGNPAGPRTEHAHYPHVRKPFTRETLLKSLSRSLESARVSES